jgi:hypothetical protein
VIGLDCSPCCGFMQKRLEGPAQPAKHKQEHARSTLLLLLLASSVFRDGALQFDSAGRGSRPAGRPPETRPADPIGNREPAGAPGSCGRWSCLLFFQSSGGWRGGGPRGAASSAASRTWAYPAHGSSLRRLAPLHCASAVVLCLAQVSCTI